MYSTKSSPSINAPGDRPGRLSRTHSTSSDRSSCRSREKQLLTGAASRPHSSCGVITADQGREGLGVSRSRPGVRDLTFPARKHHEERSEAHPHGSGRHASDTKVSSVVKTQVEGEKQVAKGSVIDDVPRKDHSTDKSAVKPKKDIGLPGVDKRKEKSHKGREPVTKTRSIDNTAAKGHDSHRHGHERKPSAGKAEVLSKISSSTREDKPCHSQKESHVRGHKERRSEGHSEHFFRRDSSNKMTDGAKGDKSDNQAQTGHLLRRHSSNRMVTDRSKGDHQSKPATSGATKSSTSRKDSHNKEEKHQKVVEAKRRPWSWSADKASKPSGGGHRTVEGKNPDQQ